eukprot:TRINITY_DN102_c1_g1_i3.p1 TRINITY_DN102_c1_g1~~TRINITY_DN102_c1_g1_i3.p1  ORF type:complete len:268 (+),score=21.61 TRINITY_DN102_c1_g1_i3:77-805(+)
MMNNHRVPAEGQNGRMERDQEEPQETIRKLTIENTQLNSRIEDIAMENVHLNRRIEELVMDNAMIGTISEETKRELGETKRELREAKRELGETKNELEATKGELREMKVRYEEQKSMNHEGINDIKRSLNAINDTLVTILEVLRKEEKKPTKKTVANWIKMEGKVKQNLLYLILSSCYEKESLAVRQLLQFETQIMQKFWRQALGANQKVATTNAFCTSTGISCLVLHLLDPSNFRTMFNKQ